MGDFAGVIYEGGLVVHPPKVHDYEAVRLQKVVVVNGAAGGGGAAGTGGGVAGRDVHRGFVRMPEAAARHAGGHPREIAEGLRAVA